MVKLQTNLKGQQHCFENQPKSKNNTLDSALREDQGALPTSGESMAANSLNIDNFSNLTHLPTQ